MHGAIPPLTHMSSWRSDHLSTGKTLPLHYIITATVTTQASTRYDSTVKVGK